jgi:hypothetical protein
MSKNSRFFRMLALLVPEVTVRVQLFSATMMWLIGASILLVRGFGYISDRHWHAWALGIGLALERLSPVQFWIIPQKEP